jgi:hypothetical protein
VFISSSVLRFAGWFSTLLVCWRVSSCLLVFDAANAIAAALGTYPLDVGIQEAAPFVPAAQAFEGDLFWHEDFLARPQLLNFQKLMSA